MLVSIPGYVVYTIYADMYSLSEHCQYGDVHDELRIVVGLHDATLSQKLQLDATLTLDKAETTIRQSEAVKSQQSVVRGEAQTGETPIEAV